MMHRDREISIRKHKNLKIPTDFSFSMAATNPIVCVPNHHPRYVSSAAAMAASSSLQSEKSK
jgi:hypothetical protein